MKPFPDHSRLTKRSFVRNKNKSKNLFRVRSVSAHARKKLSSHVTAHEKRVRKSSSIYGHVHILEMVFYELIFIILPYCLLRCTFMDNSSTILHHKYSSTSLMYYYIHSHLEKMPYHRKNPLFPFLK